MVYSQEEIENGKIYLPHCCKICGKTMEHFNGLENIPEYWYCPDCPDHAYNEDGEIIGRWLESVKLEMGSDFLPEPDRWNPFVDIEALKRGELPEGTLLK
jgi:hypothetical protein